MTLQELITPNPLWLLAIPFWLAMYVNPGVQLVARAAYLWLQKRAKEIINQ